MDEYTLWQHFIDKHGLSCSRPDAISSCKRKSSDKTEFLEWASKHGLSSSKRNRRAISTISPQLLSQPTPADYPVDEIECLTKLDFDAHLLDGYIDRIVESSQLKITDICSSDGSLFSEFLRSSSPSYMSISEFGVCNSNTILNPVTVRALSTSNAKSSSEALDHDVVQVDRLSDVAVKPIRIRLLVNPPKHMSGTNITLRLKGPKSDIEAKKKRKKA